MNKIIYHMTPYRLIIVISILITFSSAAQITKGNWLTGGSVSYQNHKYENNQTGSVSTYKLLDVSPEFGHFFFDKIAVGAKGRFYYGPYDNAYNMGYAFGPFAKYYFLKPEKIVNVFAQVNAEYFENNNRASQNNHKSSGRAVGGKAGIVAFFNSSVGVELAMAYSKAFENSTLERDLVLLSLGFQVHLDKK